MGNSTEGRTPLGRYVVHNTLEPAVNRAPKGNQSVIWTRFGAVKQHQPDFDAIGKAGFSGYVVFGFERLGLYLLESIYYGNATHVFDKNWQRLSKMTKAEILSESLQFARLIHRINWPTKLRKILNRTTSRAV